MKYLLLSLFITSATYASEMTYAEAKAVLETQKQKKNKTAADRQAIREALKNISGNWAKVPE